MLNCSDASVDIVAGKNYDALFAKHGKDLASEYRRRLVDAQLNCSSLENERDRLYNCLVRLYGVLCGGGSSESLRVECEWLIRYGRDTKALLEL